MLNSKRILQPGHAGYANASSHALNWKTAIHTGMIIVAFLFIAGVIFGAV